MSRIKPLARNELLPSVMIAFERHGNIADHIYNEVAREYTSHDMITLIAFAGQMIAANVFNNVTETDIDEYLVEYLPPIKFS